MNGDIFLSTGGWFVGLHRDSIIGTATPIFLVTIQLSLFMLMARALLVQRLKARMQKNCANCEKKCLSWWSNTRSCISSFSLVQANSVEIKVKYLFI